MLKQKMQMNKTTAALVLVLIFCVIGFALTSNPNIEMKEDTLITGNAAKNSLTGMATIDPGCTAEKTIATISDLTNAHIAADSSYSNKVCAAVAGSKTCTATNIIGYVYPVAAQGHFSVTDNGWTPLCYGNMKCIYGNYATDCSDAGADYECILSYTDGAPTDAHVGDCSALNSDYGRICCKTACEAEKAICSVSSECCNLSTGYIFDQYCSYGINEDLSQGHCCEKGYYWNPSTSECEEATECYPLPCPYDSQIPSQYELLLKDIRCLRPETTSWNPPYSKCCCHTVRYGEDGFYWCDMKATGG